MSLFRCRKLRFLYLLALLQLVGGPLVLLHVTVFCQLTVSEAPRIGVARAVVAAISSPEFRAVADLPGEKEARKDGHDGSPKPDGGKTKQPVLPGENFSLALFPANVPHELFSRERHWTPQWAHAPPAPPPRVA